MPNIMVIDDSCSMRALVKQTLVAAGHTVFEAEDGVDALAKVGARGFDLFVCDVNMPRMDGLSLVRKLRALPACKFAPILMLTTEVCASKKQEAKSAGATGWLVKPFKPDQLIATVQKVLT